MSDLQYIDRDTEVKIVGQDSTGLRVNYVGADANGNLNVIDYSNGSVTGGTAATVSSLIGGQFNTVLPTLTNGQQSAIQVDSSGRLLVHSSNFPSTIDVNYGTVGASTIRTAAEIGNATGAADFAAGNSSAQTLRVVVASNQVAIPVTQSTSPWITKDQSDGPVTPGAVASFSQLIGGQYNSPLPTLTNAQQSALQLDTAGRLLINASGVAVGVADESAFTYGTTVQLVVGGVYQDTSPALTAGQQGAVRLTQDRALHSNLRNSSGIEISSDNNGNANNQRLNVAVPDTTTANATLGALNATVSIVMSGLGAVGFQINAGTLIGTLTPEISIDGGTTWLATYFFNVSANATVPTLVFGSANTLTIYSIVTLGGTSNVRVRVSAYASGSATALMRASEATTGGVSSTFGGSSAAFGTVSNTYPATGANTATQILAANPARKYAYIANSTGTAVNIQMSSGTGLSTTTGLQIPAKSFYEFKGDNLYTGAIFAFAASNITLSVTEGTP